MRRALTVAALVAATSALGGCVSYGPYAYGPAPVVRVYQQPAPVYYPQGYYIDQQNRYEQRRWQGWYQCQQHYGHCAY
jgi:hypothetical protein